MALFEPLVLGKLILPNRFVMAPLTRCRAKLPGHVPTAMIAEHYAQRASAGLIIAEATMVTEHGSAFYMEPGIHSAEQVAAWKATTSAVHDKGGRIFLQIWHGGRACHPLNNDNVQCVAPCDVAIPHRVPGILNPTNEAVMHAQPRCLADSELPGIRDAFVAAAKNAMAAGFDGVELHCANGYLLDEFLRDGTNKRQPPYGGSLANRCRFPLEVIQSVCEAIGSDRVGVRISPIGSYNEMKDSDPVGLVTYLGNELNKLHIAYLHVIRGDMDGAQKGDVMTPARSTFKGILIGNMGYTADEANAAIESKLVDAVAFGVPFISNPDLPIRVRAKLPLLPPKPEHFFSHGVEGYNDYPLCTARH